MSQSRVLSVVKWMWWIIIVAATAALLVWNDVYSLLIIFAVDVFGGLTIYTSRDKAGRLVGAILWIIICVFSAILWWLNVDPKYSLLLAITFLVSLITGLVFALIDGGFKEYARFDEDM